MTAKMRPWEPFKTLKLLFLIHAIGRYLLLMIYLRYSKGIHKNELRIKVNNTQYINGNCLVTKITLFCKIK